MEKLLVDIHIPSRNDIAPKGEHIDDRLKDWGRPELVIALQKLGMDVVFTKGAEAFNFDNQTVNILSPKISKIDGTYQVTVVPSVVSINSLDAIRNTTKSLKNDLPELNHASLRAATGNKLTTNVILESLGLSKNYAAFGDESPEMCLEAIITDSLILKPSKGSQSKGVVISTKAELMQLVRDGKIDFSKQWIVEEVLDFSPAMPVRGINKAEQEKINFANKNCQPKELRVYCFGRLPSGELEHSYVLRVAAKGDKTLSNDKWVYVDPKSVPEDILAQTDTIARAFEKHAAVKEIHIAVDWAYVQKQGDDAPGWLPMEVNGGEPQLVYEKNNPELAKEHATKLANQLYRVASQRSTLSIPLEDAADTEVTSAPATTLKGVNT